MPKHEHDCTSCTSYGTVISRRGNKADLYGCPQNGHFTLVVRTSSEPGDYQSMPDWEWFGRRISDFIKEE